MTTSWSPDYRENVYDRKIVTNTEVNKEIWLKNFVYLANKEKQLGRRKKKNVIYGKIEV